MRTVRVHLRFFVAMRASWTEERYELVADRGAATPTPVVRSHLSR